jgi:acetyltransferase-like isoleucine patch superfamily enzyme
MKQFLLDRWLMERIVRRCIARSRFFHFRVPLVGRWLSRWLDRRLLQKYGIDLMAFSIDVRSLSIAHPVGVLLGGNGIHSPGRVAIMAGVKFVARSPNDPEYLARHKHSRVFVLGDNVVIGSNSVVIGPVDICDDVLVGAMSLVNRSITEPGVYVGVPVRKVADAPGEEWVAHLPRETQQ